MRNLKKVIYLSIFIPFLFLCNSCNNEGFPNLQPVEDKKDVTFEKASNDIIYEIITTIKELDNNNQFLENYLANHGLPLWDQNIIDYDKSRDYFYVTIPFVKNEIITSLMIVNNLNSNLDIKVIERKEFTKLQDNDIDSIDVEKWFLPASRFLYLQHKIENIYNDNLNNWIKKAADVNSEQAVERCDVYEIVWWGYGIGEGGYYATGGSYIAIDCGGASGGGSGSGDIGIWWTGNDDIEPEIIGGGGGSNEGTELSDLFHCESIEFETTNSCSPYQQIPALCNGISLLEIKWCVSVTKKICVHFNGEREVLDCLYNVNYYLSDTFGGEGEMEVLDINITPQSSTNYLITASIRRTRAIHSVHCQVTESITYESNPCSL